jgi:CRISPR-associated protein Csm2
MGNIVLDYTKDEELFNETAKEWAKEIRRDRKTTQTTQMRNFYDYVLDLQSKVEDKKEEIKNILPFVKMLNSKVHYANARNVAGDKFVEMIKQCVSQVKNETTLKTFKLFFEAVIGFSKSRE